MNRVNFIDLGLKDYKETWDFQQEIQNNVIRAKTGEDPSSVLPCLIFVEHPHVYTLGKSGKENNLLIHDDFIKSINASYYKIDRGGDITYHGPGQLVGYPVFDLDALKIGVKKYIQLLEESIILMLSDFGITAGRLDGATGVWIESSPMPKQKKICAIGVKISRGVTMHGFALNVSTDLTYFSWINPCGFTDKGVTSMEKETGQPVSMDVVKKALIRRMEEQFGIEIPPFSRNDRPC
ncbi:MAG TPA: lipoyl(octanoyl) transferase LipB [Bacteroidales bacterium]|nr:lipoyl(octanoyl) transferase LipB [Bacteroidales bacterium]